MLIIKSLEVGPLAVNCYIAGDEIKKKAIVIDPGDEPDRVLEAIKDSGLEIVQIVLTHAHFDHVGAVAELKEATGAKVALHTDEVMIYECASDQAAFWGYELKPLPKPDVLLKDGDNIMVGGLTFNVMHTPGHSPGSISLYGEGVAITGDTLFKGSVGRTDFPGGDIGKLKDSFRRLMSLPDDTLVAAGHGPTSTIKAERAGNIFSAEFLG